jgi:signal transduction histidine kinase
MNAPLRARWLTGLAVAVVVVVNLAGIGGIAIARRTAFEEGERAFGEETASRGRALEAVLTTIRSDLAFVAASSPVARLNEAPHAPAAALRRAGAESALLLFLRAHPQVLRVFGRSSAGEPLVHVGRRGGVPVLWVSSNPTGNEGVAMSPNRLRLSTTLTFDAGGEDSVGVALETEIDPATLLAPTDSEAAADRDCQLFDAGGRRLARTPAPAEESPGRIARAEVLVNVEDWSAPGPWKLQCQQPEARARGRMDALSGRYRTTLSLNLGVMALTLLLGAFVVQQARRRERLESRAREEARVRELERQLFHAERLTTVGRLAAGIAHEINNPLEGMANWLSLAKSAVDKGDTPSAAGHLGRVKEGLDRAAGIVRQVLAHSDPAKAPHEPIDLNQVLRETQEFVRSRKEFGAVDFRLDLSSSRQIVRGSPVMLGQVAVNLILNACEAQPNGGEMIVSSRADGGFVVAEFADRGPGIAAADRERVFEPFFSTKDSTGLGLSICHSIVQQHAGDLSVAPRPGGGTVFRMKIPAIESAGQ